MYRIKTIANLPLNEYQVNVGGLPVNVNTLEREIVIDLYHTMFGGLISFRWSCIKDPGQCNELPNLYEFEYQEVLITERELKLITADGTTFIFDRTGKCQRHAASDLATYLSIEN
jgi:hypothetical protein